MQLYDKIEAVPFEMETLHRAAIKLISTPALVVKLDD